MSPEPSSSDKVSADDINILLIGETGVGKSTWINSIAMYLSYDDFDEAKSAEILNLIPTDFDYTDDDGEEIQVKIGQNDSENENLEPGVSHTIKPKAHLFAYKDRVVRIIDTPGIADTRGIADDKKNVQEIIKYISDLSHISLIVFLLEPNQSRLTTAFEFCFKELIMQFHRSAAENIVFAITKSAGCDFKISGTATLLKILLKKIKDCQNIVIPLKDSTKYVFDNCSYEYFCIKSSPFSTKVNFSKEAEKLYRRSYEVSRNELLRLFDHAENVEAHNPQSTALLNYTRNVILHLSGPLAMISIAVQKTLEGIREREAAINQYEGKEGELEMRLFYPITIVKFRMEKQRAVVCLNCATVEHYKGAARLPYIEADPSCANEDPIIMYCGGDCVRNASGNYYCPKCYFKSKKVKTTKVYYRYVHEEMREDTTVRIEMNNVKKNKVELANRIAQETLFKDEISKEKDVIIKAAAKFATYLKTSSIIPYNDVTDDYLRILIEVEEKKNGVHSEYYKSLCQMLEEYRAEKEILDKNLEAVNNGEGGITIEDIQEVVTQLRELKHYGANIASVLQDVIHGNESGTEKYGHLFVPVSKPRSSSWISSFRKWLPFI